MQFSSSSMSFNEDQNGAVSRLLSVGYASGRVVIVSVASEVSHWEELSVRYLIHVIINLVVLLVLIK